MHDFPRATMAVVLAALLAGCGAGSKKSTQVVATVNDEEITINQLDLALQQAKVESASADLAKQAMESLVNEELLVQEAVKNKLDREPAVVQAIEQARRKVLAQYFAERKVFARTPPSDTQVRDYYTKNPLLFENRKLYRFTAFSTAKSDITAALRTELDQAHSVDKVRASLEKHGIRYTTQIATIAPEQVLSDRLKDFADASVGDLLMWGTPEGGELLMSVTAIEESPVSLAQATPMIRQYLVNASRKAALEAYLAQTKATARIAYVRDVAPPMDVPAEAPGVEQAAAERDRVIQDGIADLK
jgi:peptidyl-prolyl cis-trans isomerase C